MEKLEKVARYCCLCIHRRVCKYTDIILKYEESNARIGTGNDYRSTPLTYACNEKIIDKGASYDR